MTRQVTVQGLVQGVGFRPFVCRLARQLGIRGNVANCSNGVVINLIHSDDASTRVFLERLQRECPPVAAIHRITEIQIGGSERLDNLHNINEAFSIIASTTKGNEVTQVSPDIAVCDDCLRDRKQQPNRILYPFINCTHCGPRFSIIKDLPYDRPHTTMAAFEMCEECRRDYDDPQDRRFHAQPIACNHCGPGYYAYHQGEMITGYARLLAASARALADGELVAVKGIGGYHLACDATNETAVQRMRDLKRRDNKPFAILFPSSNAAAPYVEISAAERASLESWRRPIVLLRQRPEATAKPLARGLNPGMRNLGCLLPYVPLHYDWFEQLATPALVLTSGNVSDIPIAISEDEAREQCDGKVALILHHNRDIHNRADDSIVQICGVKPQVVRRSRGYTPEPFFVDVRTEGTLAFGAEKTGSFALGKDDTVLMSQHIGDLENWETFQFYDEALTRFQHLFRFAPSQLVCDLHPDYLSSRAAEKMAAEKNLPLLRVQHHHAHAAACMLEHRLHEPLIAVVWDAVGLGDDGTIWGGECFLCDRKRYTRLAHLECVPMPGGDKTAREPWRMALAWLRHYQLPIPEEFSTRIGSQKIDQLTSLLDSGINCPLTSSAGRLFDALASLLGVCDFATRQAEAPVLLEHHAADDVWASYDMENMSARPLFAGVLADMRAHTSTHIISAKIHQTFARLIVSQIQKFQRQTGANQALITGGCFQNKLLTERIQELCNRERVTLYCPEMIPCNDSGVAIGQLAVATAT